MDKEKWVEIGMKVVGFLSKRLSIVIAYGIVLVKFPQIGVLNACLLCGAVIAYICSQTYLDKKAIDAKLPTGDNGNDSPAGKIPGVVPALLLAGLLACSSANASVLDFIDKLDLQAGPALAVEDFKPFKMRPALLTTGKVYSKSRFELRLGWLVDDIHRAPVLGIARDMSDVRIRTAQVVRVLPDGAETTVPGEDKVLLPSIGLWLSAEINKELQADGTEKSVINWTAGINAVMIEY